MAAPASSRAAAASLITACWSTQVIYVAVTTGIPDKLAAGVCSSAELARVAGAHPRSMFRLLRALAALGLCSHVADDRFELTEAGQFLRSDVPDSLAILALHWGGRTWPALGHLEESLRSGAAWTLGGREGFFSMAERPHDAAVLNRSMANQTLLVAQAIVNACDFSACRNVVDLGGGYGALLSVLLRTYPQLRGASADLAYMESDARTFLREAGVAERATFIRTDFFKAVDPGADCYLLKFIIHDWDDADAIEILNNTRVAAGSNGRILLVEQVAPERTAPAHATVIRGDIQMMVSTGGMERTATEYRRLLTQAGLELVRILPTASQFSILEARAAATA
jgi:O-methyltransferase domain/Dimerisation domain